MNNKIYPAVWKDCFFIQLSIYRRTVIAAFGWKTLWEVSFSTIHKVIVALVHHAESAVQALFLFFCKVFHSLSHMARCLCCIVTHDKFSPAPLLDLHLTMRLDPMLTRHIRGMVQSSKVALYVFWGLVSFSHHTGHMFIPGKCFEQCYF